MLVKGATGVQSQIIICYVAQQYIWHVNKSAKFRNNHGHCMRLTLKSSQTAVDFEI